MPGNPSAFHLGLRKAVTVRCSGKRLGEQRFFLVFTRRCGLLHRIEIMLNFFAGVGDAMSRTDRMNTGVNETDGKSSKHDHRNDNPTPPRHVTPLSSNVLRY